MTVSSRFYGSEFTEPFGLFPSTQTLYSHGLFPLVIKFSSIQCSARNDVGVETTQAMLTVLEETAPEAAKAKVPGKESAKGKAVTIAGDDKSAEEVSVK